MREEIAAKSRQPRADEESALFFPAGGQGWLAVTAGALPGRALIFERQRLPDAERLPEGSPAELARAVSGWLAERGAGRGPPAAVHVFPAEPAAGGGRTRRAERLAGALREALPEVPLNDMLPGKGSRRAPAAQVCVTDAGDWISLAPVDRLTSSFPGGIVPLAGDTGAPSRSAMKLEEALVRFGDPPRVGQQVVDLGAAPGGWSRAMLKRGCRVTAVDRGPLRLQDAAEWGGRLTHLRQDGLRYRPERPVDWLLSDMLVPPGVVLGLLRKWVERGWMRRFIVNVKLPQRHPYGALEPLETFLEETLGGEAEIRQLWHDRREVTAWGRVPAAASPPVTGRPSGRRGGATTSKPRAGARKGPSRGGRRKR